jgi:hypothetical protein
LIDGNNLFIKKKVSQLSTKARHTYQKEQAVVVQTDPDAIRAYAGDKQ